MQYTYPVNASPSPDLAKHVAVFWSLLSRVIDVMLPVGTTVCALGSIFLCLLVVLPCLFLITLAGQVVLWPLQWAYK